MRRRPRESVGLCVFVFYDFDYMRPSVLWNIQARARGRNPEGELPCILHKTLGFLMLHVYVFYITTTPYLPCNNNINRTELYDFYYTAITLTTGYNTCIWSKIVHVAIRGFNYRHSITHAHYSALAICLCWVHCKREPTPVPVLFRCPRSIWNTPGFFAT